MDGSLISIWQESGNNLRFGEAKCIFLFSISLAILIAYLQSIVSSDKFDLSIVHRMYFASLMPLQYTTIAVMCISVLTSLTAITPVLSSSSKRVDLLCRLGKIVRLLPPRQRSASIVYFMDIAAFGSADNYEASLHAGMARENNFNSGERELVAQIWFVSRIAASKYVLLTFSAYALIIACALAFVLSAAPLAGPANS
jgi:Family of unknown function (DUF5706)